MSQEKINSGITAFRNGDKKAALQIFSEIVKSDPRDETAWLWLAAAVDNIEQKKFCFTRVLDINPNNTNAQKALAELELKRVQERRPIPQSGTVLKCPSCGSVMGQPDHTGLVQCSYCGTAITYHPPAEKVEQKNVERYLELCNASLDGKNYEETLVYANKILEIDPKNSSAWINKGIATYWLTTSENNRYDEAMGYLKKAEELSQNNENIQKIKGQLTYEQAYWYVHLGNKKVELGDEIYDIYNSGGYDNLLDIVEKPLEAQRKSIEHFNDAMGYFLLAAAYLPNDTNILRNIENLAKNRNWFNGNSMVQQRIKDLQILRAKERLPMLNQELLQTEQDLANLKKDKGLFNIFKIDEAEDKIKQLKDEIAIKPQNSVTRTNLKTSKGVNFGLVIFSVLIVILFFLCVGFVFSWVLS